MKLLTLWRSKDIMIFTSTTSSKLVPGHNICRSYKNCQVSFMFYNIHLLALVFVANIVQ